MRYLKDNREYSFRLGDFIIPKYISSIKGNKINLARNRINNLNQGSSWSPKFRELLKDYYPGLYNIREFPLLIEDRKYWNSLCDQYNVSEKGRNRNYFLADYLFPDYNFIVEIDSELHDLNYDIARDNYIVFSFGVSTLRLFEFGRDPLSDIPLINDFDIELYRMKHGGRALVDYSSAIVNRFYADNKEIMNAVDVISANLQHSVNGVFDASDYRSYFTSPKIFYTVRDIIWAVFELKLIVKAWGI